MLDLDQASRELIERSEHTRQLASERRRAIARDPALTEAQSGSLAWTLDGVDEALVAAVEALRSAASPERYSALEKQLNRLESARALVEVVFNQRADNEAKRALQLADGCALAGYQRFTEKRDDVPTAPPIVVLEPQDAPAMTPPRASVMAPSFFGSSRLTTMVPLLYLPPSYIWSIAQLSTLQHEIGHVCDERFQLRTHFAALLPELIAGSEWDDLGPRRRRQCWTNWMPEILADVVGVVLGGRGFATALSYILVGRGMSQASELESGSVYPPGSLRLYLIEQLLRERGIDQVLTSEVAQGPLAKLAADVPALLPRLLHDVIPGLPSRSLGALADSRADEALTERLAAALQGDAEADLEASVRLLPGAVRLACERAPERSAAIRAAALRLGGQLKAPNWVMSEGELSALKAQAKQRPVLVDEIDGRSKVPPLPLLKEHHQIAFVGATHWQLVERLRTARVERARDWQFLEVFALAEGPLAWFASPAQPEATLRERRAKALAELQQLLPEIAQRWALFEYDQPLFFGSFWDLDEPCGRIHVSPAVWGLELKSCPGQDYLRGDSPSIAYAAYATGLTVLRERSRKLAGS